MIRFHVWANDPFDRLVIYLIVAKTTKGPINNLKFKIMKTLKLSEIFALASATALIVLTIIAICNTTLYE